MSTTTTERIAAHKLRPGTQIMLYGGPVYVTDVQGLPEAKPAQRVRIAYRKDFANGSFLVGQTVVPATISFEVHDDGLAF